METNLPSEASVPTTPINTIGEAALAAPAVAAPEVTAPAPAEATADVAPQVTEQPSIADQIIAESAAASQPSADSVEQASARAQELLSLQERQRKAGILATFYEQAARSDWDQDEFARRLALAEAQ